MSATAARTLIVPEMSCQHCVNAITGEVGSLTGVDSVLIDLDAKSVVVSGTDLNEQAIRAAIVEAGYAATP